MLAGACGDDIPTVVAGLTEGLPAGVVTTSTGGTSHVDDDDSTGLVPLPSEDELPTAIAVAACGAAAACDCPNYDAGKCVIEIRESFEQWQHYAESKGFAFDQDCLLELLDNVGNPEGRGSPEMTRNVCGCARRTPSPPSSSSTSSMRSSLCGRPRMRSSVRPRSRAGAG